MPTHSWYINPSIEFYAGRYFTHQGVDYTPGDKLPEGTAQAFPNLEGAVRGRYLIPIAQDKYDIPRHLWGEAQTFETVLRKHQERAVALNLPGLESQEAPQPEDPYPVFDPSEHTVPEVIAYCQDHSDEVEDILEAERADKNRVTLVEALEDMLTTP